MADKTSPDANNLRLILNDLDGKIIALPFDDTVDVTQGYQLDFMSFCHSIENIANDSKKIELRRSFCNNKCVTTLFFPKEHVPTQNAYINETGRFYVALPVKEIFNRMRTGIANNELAIDLTDHSGGEQLRRHFQDYVQVRSPGPKP